MKSPLRSPAAIDWHALTVPEAVAALDSDLHQGLPLDRVQQRRQQYGPNELEEAVGRSPLAIWLDQFKNIMLLMLIAVALISAGLDLRDQQFPKDAIAIFIIIFLNAWLGYVQESRAEKALAALKQMTSPQVRVIRGGQDIEVNAKELVPGDLIHLEAGVTVPADGRLISANHLELRESALTGEAAVVRKRCDQTLPEATVLGDRINLVFQGTEVVQGRGVALVTAIGMQTELGHIAEMLQTVEAEPTPLQQRMTQLGNALVGGSLTLVVLVVMGGIWQTGNLGLIDELLEISLSMAVAVVPEGLPAVITVTLALGTQRMVRRQALIRKLPAVETLGSVTTICSDKTGTLTQNKMVVQRLQLAGKAVQVTGNGYDPRGEFLDHTYAFKPERHPDLMRLLVTGALCNDAALQKEAGDWSILGDPTEGALLVLARKAGFDPQQWNSAFARQAEIPFSSERKRMSVLCATHAADPQLQALFPQDYAQFIKGSPELVLERSTRIQVGDRIKPLTQADRQAILAQNNQLASQGLRVLGLAYESLHRLPPLDDPAWESEALIWLGLVGMLDAPRSEAKAAVALCQAAGIRPVMITGDHQLTAMAIARSLGIAREGEPVLNGHDLEQLSPEELEQQVDCVNVYARVAPEHKLRIVRALQRHRAVVAMTGDGVNDAPALKQADIGIAMGITGTDVSKEASDMVLLDDNFATIVAATEEGRVIYSNIRRFIKYILGSNIGEVFTIAAAPLLGLGTVPLTPLQILWMNLVTDGLPALALAMEPAEDGVMQRPPHHPRESIFARGLGFYMIRIGIVLSILTITLMSWAFRYTQSPGYTGDPENWKTMVFTTLCLAQMGHALAVRSATRMTIQINFWSNPYLIGAIALTTLLQMCLLYIPPVQQFFGVRPLSLMELGICFGVSTLMFVWVELEKGVVCAVKAWRHR
ncbi:cation-translocating P-type ATPase [Lyngbya confervoides]|uniref:Cation-transporting P-type ATPase n=1 Tax=Lyngbya confervoides BDU141951 TaxID=1574623 RepID=A0ABD4T883_9CYAN|nr:cation-transporting P-type ATPase [Lyngbya confervoides]MCM1984841.1 cation-transporting P-type ATPase [Lyngbya confervoides BDU141951]